MFTLLVFHDGRNDYLGQALSTFFDQVYFPGPVHKILVDDMPIGRDLAFLDHVRSRFGFDDTILNDRNLGSFGSIMKAWANLPPETQYVFHLENDFVFAARVEVEELMTVLEEPAICNITLLRQPWYEDERKGGSLFSVYPERFRETEVRGIPVCLHRDYFGHNPGLYRREFTRIIPDTSRSIPGVVLSHERIYRDLLLAEDPSRQFAILGRLTDRPRVFHIGYRRTGVSPEYEASQGDPSVMYAGEDTQLRAVELESRVLLHSATALEHHIQHVLEPALVTLEHERDSTMRTVEMQRGALAAAQFESTALRKSWSWRITKPMRLALDLLSRIRKS